MLNTHFVMANTFLTLNITTSVVLVFLLALPIYCDKHMSDVHTSTFLLKRLIEDEINFVEYLNRYLSAVEDH